MGAARRAAGQRELAVADNVTDINGVFKYDELRLNFWSKLGFTSWVLQHQQLDGIGVRVPGRGGVGVPVCTVPHRNGVADDDARKNSILKG